MSLRDRFRWAGVTTLVLCLLASLLSCSEPPGDVLASWRSALAHQSERPATWLAIGDSLTEGQGASARDRRWIDLTAASLRLTGAPGGEGYLPGWSAVYGPDSPWRPYTSRTGVVTDESARSLGLRSALLTAPASQSYEVSGTSVDLYYATPGGVLTYAVDGGPAVSVDTSGTASTANRTHVVLPGAGEHTLTLAAVTGTVSLSGVFGYDDDERSGVHLYDAAHSGWTLGQFVAAEGETDPVVSLVQPDLVTIELGVNDYLRDGATPEQVHDDLRRLVVDLRRQLDDRASLVLVLPYGIPPADDGSGRTWDAYAAAIRSVSTQERAGLLDLSSMGTATPGGSWSADGLHPTDAGQRTMAQLATAYLSTV